jgi:hypothetical protein
VVNCLWRRVCYLMTPFTAQGLLPFHMLGNVGIADFEPLGNGHLTTFHREHSHDGNCQHHAGQ